MNLTGLSPQNALKYLGPNVYLPIIVSRLREPTSADIKQPETGKYYSFGTLWMIGKSPTTGIYGDIWYLANIQNNAAVWNKLSSGLSGPILDVEVDANTSPGTNPVLPIVGTISITGAQVSSGAIGTNVIRTNSLAPHQFTIEIQRASSSETPDSSLNGVSHFNEEDFDVDEDGFVSLSGTGVGQTITGDDAIPLSPVAGNWNILGLKNGAIPVVETSGAVNTLLIEDRTSTTAYVVDSSAGPGQRGTFQTIQSAIDAAISGATVFIKDGIYIENLTLKAGVNLASYVNGSFTPNVTIIGKCSFSENGITTISGIAFQTSGDYAISVTGSVASRLYLVECNVVCSNFSAIELASSSSGAFIRLVNSWCTTTTNSTNFFAASGSGGLMFWNVNVVDTTPQTIPSTFASTGTLNVKYSIIRFPITTTGTGRISATNGEFNTFQTNSTPLVISADASAGSGFGNYLRGCAFLAGNNVTLTINELVHVVGCIFVTTGSTSIDGTGTIRQSGSSYTNTNPVPSSTGLTISRQPFDAGLLYGNWSGVAPSSGYVGEMISSFVDTTSGVPLVTITPVNVTSIILTPGTWDVSGMIMYKGITTAVYQIASIGTTSATISSADYGNSTISTNHTTTAGDSDGMGLSIPPVRYNVPFGGGNLTVYLIACVSFSASSSPVAYGSIKAIRAC